MEGWPPDSLKIWLVFQAPPVENRLYCLTPSSDQDIFSPYHIKTAKKVMSAILKAGIVQQEFCWFTTMPGNCTGFINPLTPRNDSQVTSP